MNDAIPARPNRLRPLIWGGALALLLLPGVAMQFTPEVNWTASDFVVWAVMLLAAAGAYEFLARMGGGAAYRIGAGLMVLTTFFLIWVNLAVGIIGSENNDANMMYAAVIAIVVGGSCIAHLRAALMVRVVVAAAIATIAVAFIALAGDLGTDGIAWPRDVIGVTVILTGLWLTAAALFALAARQQG